MNCKAPFLQNQSSLFNQGLHGKLVQPFKSTAKSHLTLKEVTTPFSLFLHWAHRNASLILHRANQNFAYVFESINHSSIYSLEFGDCCHHLPSCLKNNHFSKSQLWTMSYPQPGLTCHTQAQTLHLLWQSILFVLSVTESLSTSVRLSGTDTALRKRFLSLLPAVRMCARWIGIGMEKRARNSCSSFWYHLHLHWLHWSWVSWDAGEKALTLAAPLTRF